MAMTYRGLAEWVAPPIPCIMLMNPPRGATKNAYILILGRGLWENAFCRATGVNTKIWPLIVVRHVPFIVHPAKLNYNVRPADKMSFSSTARKLIIICIMALVWQAASPALKATANHRALSIISLVWLLMQVMYRFHVWKLVHQLLLATLWILPYVAWCNVQQDSMSQTQPADVKDALLAA